jgi:2-keto-4-pentenoate hydratase/2-oxohepta-3-ene-1,7-dioic acid hydratase in catechol pathway
MRLPTGSIVGLGSAGWDGVPVNLGSAPDSRVQTVLELGDVGELRVTLRRARPDEEGRSPFLAARAKLGLPPTPPPEQRPGRSLWVLHGNYPQVRECEGLPAGPGLNPNLYPATALREDDAAIILPPHATEVRCSVHLAGVIGPEPIYNVTAEKALAAISHVAPLISLRDTSLADPIREPTPYEWRATCFLGRCGEGFFRLGPLTPLSNSAELPKLTMKLAVAGVGRAEYRADNYVNGLADMARLVSRLTTLLPGDVLSLGTAGPELRIPADVRPGPVEVATSWGAAMKLSFDDQRDPAAREKDFR